MLDKNVILIGYSGHGYVVADVAMENGFKLVGYTDKKKLKHNPYKINYLGYEKKSDFFSNHNKEIEYILGIGDNHTREKIYNLIRQNNKEILTLISSSSIISNSVKMGKGVFINKNVIVNALVTIGNNVILNTGCIIEHECKIGDSSHIAPGAVIAGGVSVGERSLVGANAFIKQGVNIGRDVIIGAGTVVLQNIPDRKKVIGNPSRFI